MAVTGADRVIAAFRRAPELVRQRIQDALPRAAQPVFDDMRAFTPIDPASPGAHARDGLTMIVEDDGLKVSIGLPTVALASEYFWFRFLDGGTAGGEVSYRKAGSATLHTMRVPSRPAFRIRERALDGNIDEVERLLRQAILDGLRQVT